LSKTFISSEFMQIFALNNQNKVVQASEAAKKQNYTCLECRAPLRLREGEIRQAHFYHVQPNKKCSLHQKSLRHLQVQWRLQQLLGNCQLEVPFTAIKRIADVVWFDEKIVFEVQCSPITAQEVLQRNKDYNSQGFQVVWLLHDSRYNQWRISSAENALTCSPHYFTDIDRQGDGIIYDQYAYVYQGFRKEKTTKCPIDVTQVIRQIHPLPKRIRSREWPLFFKGDLVSRPCPSVQQIEERWDLRLKPKRNLLRNYLIRPYLAIFRYFLDAVSD
jgi:competence protein CoiA